MERKRLRCLISGSSVEIKQNSNLCAYESKLYSILCVGGFRGEHRRKEDISLDQIPLEGTVSRDWQVFERSIRLNSKLYFLALMVLKIWNVITFVIFSINVQMINEIKTHFEMLCWNLFQTSNLVDDDVIIVWW